jgi:PDZ domain-containing secreted protein
MLLKLFKTCIILFLASSIVNAQNNVVTIVKKEQQWTLLINNNPYYIRGAGGEKYLKEVVAIGGNTIRTWGLENAQTVLDEAQKLGIKVMLGMWVQHERHGFDYNDEAKIKDQLEGFRTQIKKFKNVKF